MRLGGGAAAAFALGAVLLLVAESTVLRGVALVLLFAGLAAGTFAIASPGFVERDRD